VAVITRVADSEDVDHAVVAERRRERGDYRHAAPSVRGEGFAASLRQRCFKKSFNEAFAQVQPLQRQAVRREPDAAR
jgi:hypothetical protein